MLVTECALLSLPYLPRLPPAGRQDSLVFGIWISGNFLLVRKYTGETHPIATHIFFRKRLKYLFVFNQDMVLKHSKIVLHEHKVTNFIRISHDSIDIFRMFLHHQDSSAVPCCKYKRHSRKIFQIHPPPPPVTTPKNVASFMDSPFLV